MALSKVSKDYLNEYSSGHGRGKYLIEVLKDVLTDVNVTAIKAGMKNAEIARLNVQKAAIDAELVKLNK